MHTMSHLTHNLTHHNVACWRLCFSFACVVRVHNTRDKQVHLHVSFGRPSLTLVACHPHRDRQQTLGLNPFVPGIPRRECWFGRSHRAHTHATPTARGFEPLRAEPNGFLIHHLNHSVTLSRASSFKTEVRDNVSGAGASTAGRWSRSSGRPS